MTSLSMLLLIWFAVFVIIVFLHRLIKRLFTRSPRNPASNPRRDELDQRYFLVHIEADQGGLTDEDWAWLAAVGWNPAVQRAKAIALTRPINDADVVFPVDDGVH